MLGRAHGLARVIVPGLPHHVTQRGNRREPIFLEKGDQEVYRNLLIEQVRRRHVEIWAYCFMPNHVHLILTPCDELGLGLAVGIAATPTLSTPEGDGRVISSRAASPRS